MLITWYGSTYIIDASGNVALYDFNESVLAATVGKLYIDKLHDDVTCFIYVSFQNDIVIYADRIKSVKAIPLVSEFSDEEMCKYSIIKEASLNAIKKSVESGDPVDLTKIDPTWSLDEKCRLFRSLLRLSTEEEQQLTRIVEQLEKEKAEGTFDRKKYIKYFDK